MQGVEVNYAFAQVPDMKGVRAKQMYFGTSKARQHSSFGAL